VRSKLSLTSTARTEGNPDGAKFRAVQGDTQAQPSIALDGGAPAGRNLLGGSRGGLAPLNDGPMREARTN